MTKPLPSPTVQERARAEELLLDAPLAYVAMAGDMGPYVVPMNFAFQPTVAVPDGVARVDTTPGRLYIHTGRGRKSRALATDSRVCVAVATDVAFYQGPTPCEDGFAYRSVLAEGRARLLEDPREREQALRAIIAKYDPDAAGMPFDEGPLAQTLVYEIAIETLTYKERPRRPAG